MKVEGLSGSGYSVAFLPGRHRTPEGWGWVVKAGGNIPSTVHGISIWGEQVGFPDRLLAKK